MFGLFKPSAPVDNDEFEWLIACFRWLFQVIDGDDLVALSNLRIASDDTILANIDSKLNGHALAEELFFRTKRQCGMENWDCDLVPGESQRESELQAGLSLKHESQPALGEFRVDSGGVSISYDPTLLATPRNLIATFAHELAHFLLAEKGNPPGGEDLLEHATDCAAVYLGFGIFMSNSACQFHQFSNFKEMGWEMRASGYLSEQALITALAISVHLTGARANPIQDKLKPHMRLT